MAGYHRGYSRRDKPDKLKKKEGTGRLSRFNSFLFSVCVVGYDRHCSRLGGVDKLNKTDIR